jgi:hypothetical protein
MLLQGKRALVTGADGFIGSRLAEALVDEGASVLAPWQFSSFKRGLTSGWVCHSRRSGWMYTDGGRDLKMENPRYNQGSARCRVAGSSLAKGDRK